MRRARDSYPPLLVSVQRGHLQPGPDLRPRSLASQVLLPRLSPHMIPPTCLHSPPHSGLPTLAAHSRGFSHRSSRPQPFRHATAMPGPLETPAPSPTHTVPGLNFLWHSPRSPTPPRGRCQMSTGHLEDTPWLPAASFRCLASLHIAGLGNCPCIPRQGTRGTLSPGAVLTAATPPPKEGR